MQLLMLQR